MTRPYSSVQLGAIWITLSLLPPILFVVFALVNIPDDKTWLDAVSAILGPMIAYSASIVALANYRLAAKRRDEEWFQRRDDLYLRYCTFETRIEEKASGELSGEIAAYLEHRKVTEPDYLQITRPSIRLLAWIIQQDVTEAEESGLKLASLFVPGSVLLNKYTMIIRRMYDEISAEAGFLIDQGLRDAARKQLSENARFDSILDAVESQSKLALWDEALTVK